MGHIVGMPSNRSGAGAPSGVPGVASDIIFIDGVQHVSAADVKWPQTSSNPTIASGASGAHGRYYDCSTNAATRDLGQNLVSISVGMRILSQTNTTSQVLLFNDSTTNQLNLQYVTGGAFAIRRNTTTLATGTFTSSLNTWYYVTLSATIDNTSGSVTARIYSDAGALLDTITFSGDTQNSANAFANRVVIGGSANDALIQDIWIASVNANYGPLRVETLYPSGDGALTQWTRAGANSGANWSQLDEAQDNSTTDYLLTGTNGFVNLSTFQNRSLTSAVYAVQVTPVGSPPAAIGGFIIRPIIRIGTTNYLGSSISFASNTFAAYPHCWGSSPDTSIGWTDSEINGAQAGFEKIAGAASMWVTQLVVEVACAA